jgi:hypothetical protein
LTEEQSFNGVIAGLSDSAGQYSNSAYYSGTLTVDGTSYPLTFTPDSYNDGSSSVSVSLPGFLPQENEKGENEKGRRPIVAYRGITT